MTKSDPHPEERIARQMLTQNRPLFLGVDGHDCAHYWDSYEFAAVVVPRNAETTTDAEKYVLDDTPLATLREWAEHVRIQRGWDTGPRVGGSFVDDLQEAMA
ncbi:hypothetical protein [Haloarcula marina]|uniref:hypothetical protein n=1 Tax=Haloarcula marina TaxID=2961574 RepID=UPI0020B722F0|nr:hypothetical protein [Halomicroarcula marina]